MQMKANTSETWEYIVPSHMITAIQYGDESGLTDQDSDDLSEFMDQVHKEVNGRAYSIEFSDDSRPYFHYSNDVCNLACDVVKMVVHVFQQSNTKGE